MFSTVNHNFHNKKYTQSMHEEATEDVTLAASGSSIREEINAHPVDRVGRELALGCLLAARGHPWDCLIRKTFE